MATKRTSDVLAVVPEAKRTKNEILAYTNKDKALLQAVRIHNLTFFLLK